MTPSSVVESERNRVGAGTVVTLQYPLGLSRSEIVKSIFRVKEKDKEK